MTDAEKIVELEHRIERLEEAIDADETAPQTPQDTGLDRRDSKVVAALEHGQSYPFAHLKRLYKQHTGIRNDSTAKQRAKSLVQRDFFQRKNRRFIFRG